MKPDSTVIAVCSHLLEEFRIALKARNLEDVDVAAPPCECPRGKWSDPEVREFLSTCADQHESMLVFYGMCGGHDAEILRAFPGTNTTVIDRAFDLLLPRPLVDRYLREGAYLLTPGWLADWKKHITDMGFDREMARDFFAESCSKLVLIDSLAYGDCREKMEALAEYLDRPFEIVPVGLDMLGAILAEQLAALPAQRARQETALVSARMADYALAFEMLGQFASRCTVKEIVRTIADFFAMTCAPDALLYIEPVDGAPMVTFSTGSKFEPTDALLHRVWSMQESFIPLGEIEGFALPLREGSETLGVFVIGGFAVPEKRQDYVNMALTLLPVLVLALVNARTYERLDESRASLQRSEEYLAATLRSIGDGVITTDAQGLVVSLNAVAENLTGWSSEEVRGVPVKDIFALVSSVGPADNPVARALESGETVTLAEHCELVSRDGTRCQVADSCAPIRDTNRNILGTVLVFRDITHEYAAREAIRRSNERFEVLAAETHTVHWECDTAARFTSVSSVATEVYGVPPSDLIGKKYLYDLGSPDELDNLRQEIKQHLQASKPFQIPERPIARPDGSQVWVSTHVVPIRDMNQILRGYQGSDIDITERKNAENTRVELEMQSRQLLKADSLARMASAIAHNFNNRLQVVQGFIEMSLETLALGDSPTQELKEALKATLNATELSTLMLTYLGQRSWQQEAIDLLATARDAVQTFKTQYPKHANMRADFNLDAGLVTSNQEDLEKSIQALLRNAAEADEDASHPIEMSLDSVPASDIPLENHFPVDWTPEPEKHYILVRVTDHGCGIPPENLPDICDPFYTTKFTGRGLGLAVVLGVARGTGGGLVVRTEPGKGCDFRMYLLPAQDKAQS